MGKVTTNQEGLFNMHKTSNDHLEVTFRKLIKHNLSSNKEMANVGTQI